MTEEIRQLQETLTSNPNDHEAFRGLKNHYKKESDWRSLVELYELYPPSDDAPESMQFSKLASYLESLIEATDSKKERGALLIALGDVYINHLQRRDDAISAYQTSFKVWPKDTLCLERARGIYMSEQEYDRVVVLYELQSKVLRKMDLTEDLARNYVSMAEVFGDKLDNPARALEMLIEANKADSSVNYPESFFERIRKHPAVKARIDQMVQQSAGAAQSNPKEAARLVLRAAHLEHLRADGEAETAYFYAEQAIELDGNNTEAQTFMQQLLDEISSQPDEPSEVEEDEPTHATMRLSAEQVAEIQSERMQEESEEDQPAVVALAPVQIVEDDEDEEAELDEEELVEDEPSEPVSHEVVVDDAESTQEAEAAPEPQNTVAMEAEDVENLQDLSRQSEGEEDGAVEDDESSEEEAAVEVAEEAAPEEAVEEEIVEEAAPEEEGEPEVAEEASDVEEDVELEEIVEDAPEEVTLEASADIGDDVYEDALARHKKDATDLDALELIKQRLSYQGQWDELVPLMERSVKYLRKKDGEFEQMLYLARVFWHKLEDMDKAEYYFKRLRHHDSEMPEVVDFYGYYFESKGQWRKLHVHLNSQLQSAEGEAPRRALTRRVATLSERELGAEKAIDAWRHFLADFPGDPEARQELRRLYEDHEKWQALVEYLRESEQELADKEDDALVPDRVALLEEIVLIYDEKIPGGDINRINALNKLLEIDPTHSEGFEQLKQLLESNRRFSELADLLNSQAESAAESGDTVRAVDLLTEVADLWQNSLNNVSKALPFLQRIVEIDPLHVETRERLKAAYEQRRDYPSLFELLEQETEHKGGDELESHLRTLLELAQERLRDLEKAVPLLEQLLELAPQDTELYGKLEFIYRRQEEWDSLVTLLERKAELDGLDDAEVIQVYKEAAQTSDTRLEDPERAARLWQGVLSLDESNATAFARLRDIYVETGDFDELKLLFGSKDMFDRYYDLLADVAGKEESVERKQELYRRMQSLAQDDLDDATRVIASLESLLQVTEDRPAVARELIGWYRQTGAIDSEIEMQKLLLEHADDDVARYVELVRLSELEIEREQDEAALRWLLDAISAQPDEESAVQKAEVLARHVGMLEVYLDHLDAISSTLDEDSVLRQQLYARIARLSRDELEDNARAIDLYEKLYELQPQNLEWSMALEHLYDVAAYPEKRIGILEVVIAQLKEEDASQERVVEQLAKIANVQHRQLGKSEEASQTYHEIIEIEPDFVPALRGLREIYTEESRWDDVMDVLEKEFELAPLDDMESRQALRMELAHVVLEFKHNPPTALGYYSDVLAQDRDHQQAMAQVERLLGMDEVARDAALLVEPILRDQQEHERLSRALEARLRVCNDTFEEQEILEELVPLYQTTLDDPESAFPRASRRFELDASNTARWEDMVQLGEILGSWSDVEQLFVRWSPLAEDSDEHTERAQLLRQVAMIREEKLDDKEGALKAWECLYTIESTDLTVLKPLERLYRELGRHAELVQVLEAKSELVMEPEARVALLLEAANLTDELLDDVSAAVVLYQRVLELDPIQKDAVEALERLLRQEERFHDLDELLANQAALSEEMGSRRNYLLQQAALRTNQLDDAQGAFGILRELVSEQPEDPRPVFLLVNLDKVVSQKDERDPVRLDIAQELEALYRDRSEYAKVIEMMEVRLSFTTDTFERLALLDELAELYLERVGDQPGSFERLKEAVILMPDELERRQRFERLGEHLDRFEEVVSAYQTAAENLDDPFVAMPLHFRSGQLLADRLLKPVEAIVAYEKALELQPEDVKTLQALEALYEQEQHFMKLADNLRAQAELADMDQRKVLLVRIGDLEETVLERPVESIDAWAELLNSDGESELALDALERLYERQEQWIDLGDILRRKAELSQEAESRIGYLAKLALVQVTRMEDITEAIMTYQQILADDPSNEAALDALDELFVREERWADLVDVLRTKLTLPSAAHNDELRVVLQLRLARILREELMSIDESLELYLQVFDRYPGQDDARNALEELAQDISFSDRCAQPLIQFYQTESLWTELVGLYDTLREQSHDPEVQANFSYRQAAVYRDQLQDFDSGFESLARAWKLVPQQDGWRSELVALTEVRNSWSELAQTYEEVLLQVSDPDRIKILRVELAVIYRDQLQEMSDAEIQLQEALNLDERDQDIYEALESMLTEQKRWSDLVELLERRYMVFIDQPNANDMLLRIALIHDEFAQDGVTAVEAYRRVLMEVPREPSSEAAIKRLLREQNREQDLAEFLEDRIMVHSDNPEAMLALKLELAKLYADKLYEPERALDLWTQILNEHPHHAETVASLEALFERDETLRQPIAELLEPLYLEKQQWEPLIHMLRTKADVEPDQYVQVELLSRIAKIAELHLKDWAQALSTYGEVFKITPEAEDVRTSLERNAERLSAWQDVIDVYTTTLDENYNIDDMLRVQLLSELALVHEERLVDLQEARETFARVFDVDPASERAFDGLERINIRLDDFTSLAELYRQRAEIQLDPTQGIIWLERLATLQEEVLDDPNEAIEVYNRISELDMNHRGAQRMLEVLYKQTGRYQDLADLYRRFMASSLDQDYAISMQYKLAHLLDTQLDDVDEALEMYRAVLGAQPGHKESMHDLEVMRRDLAGREGDFALHQEQIAEILLAQYDDARDWRRIVELLELREQLSESPEQRAEYLDRAATLIQEQTQDRTDLFQALSLRTDAWAILPESEALFAKLEDIAASLDAWERVVPQLLQGVERTDEISLRAKLLNAVAKIYQEKVGDSQSALMAYEQTFAVDPENEVALTQLDRLYSSFEHWDALGSLLNRRLEHTFDGEARINLLRRIANLYEETLGQPKEAITAYEQLREVDAGTRIYLDKLAVLYEQTEQDEQLVEVLQSKANMLTDQGERLGTYKKLAQIQHELVNDKVGAIDTYRQILAIDQNDELAVSALVDLYAERENWYELLEMLQLQRDFAADVNSLNLIDFRMSQIYLEHLDQPIETLDLLRTITARSPEWDAALITLESLLDQDSVREDVFTLLENLYMGNETYEKLAPLYEQRLQHIDDTYLRAETLSKLARIQEEKLGQSPTALMTYGRAFREVPSQEDVRAELERLAQQHEAYDELIAIYEDTLDAGVSDPLVRGALHARLGELFVNERDEVKPAITHLESVLEIDEYNMDALELLDSLYQLEQRWTDLADILERRISLASPEHVAQARFRLGHLREREFNQPLDAFDLYRQVILEQPDHRGATEALERLIEQESLRPDVCDLLETAYTQTEAWQKLAQLLKFKLDYLVDATHERADIMRRVGTLQLQRLDDPASAFQFFGMALSEDPFDLSAQESLESLTAEHQYWPSIVDLYEQLIPNCDDPIRQSELALKAGEWSRTMLEDDLDRAHKFYTLVLDVEPQHEQALGALETIARQRMNYTELVDVLTQKVELLSDPVQRFETYAEMGQLHNHLEQYEQAIDAFRDASMLDPANLEVMQSLIALYEQQERWNDLVDELERLANTDPRPETQLPVLARVGHEANVHLDDKMRALDAYERALSLAPNDVELLRAVEPLYAETSQFDRQGEILDRLLELATTDEDRVKVMVRRAQIAYEYHNDTEQAIRLFQSAYDLSPSSEIITSALDELYRKEERWEELFNLYYGQLEQTQDVARRATLAVEMARIARDHVEDLAASVQWLDYALQLEPENREALQLKLEIYSGFGDWPQVTQILGLQFQYASTAEEKIDVLLRRAALYRDTLGQSQEAIDDFVEVLNQDPHHAQAYEELTKLLNQLQAWDQLYDVMGFRATIIPEDEKKQMYLDMSEVAKKLGDSERRIDSLEKAYNLDPSDLDVVSPLLDATIAAGEFDRAEPMLEQVINTLTEKRRMKEVVQFYHLRGKLAEQRGNQEEALEIYESARKIDATYVPNLLSLGKLLYMRQDWDSALKILQTLLLHQMSIKDPQDKLDMYYYLGQVRLQTGDARRAKDMFNRALGVDANHQPSRDALEQIG